MAKRRTSRKSSNDNSLFNGNGNDASRGSGAGNDATTGGVIDAAPLRDLAEARYLNYALSVITSRALPDVRDGLKPVQRRILYIMWQQRVRADQKPRKSATIVGDVMGKLHPHGDGAIYDAMVRLAQPWVMRETLIDGQGNFGSMDGDPPAAMRYTEARLTPIAHELLTEINQGTVDWRPNYDGQHSEPVVLPARMPNLLVNGSAGIAVGMATSIPPHNLGEVCQALLRLIDNPELTAGQLARTVKGPDFPTGGEILNAPTELTDIYKTGQGSIRVRSKWEHHPAKRGTAQIHITDIPYGVNKATLIERIADIVVARKMALITDVRDISADDVRIELDVKADADPQKIMAYLFKHTPCQSNVQVNLTCLVPIEGMETCRPQRCDLREVLHHFLHFRLDVVTRRLRNELESLQNRIHILQGFALIFDALDEIIAIIRKSDGKVDAAQKIMKRFTQLDEVQTDAILELKLYRLARLEINLVTDELKDKQKRAKEINKLLNETAATGRWSIVKDEINEIYEQYAKGVKGKRLTTFASDADEPEFSAEDFIVAEDNHVLVTADGWIKRQKEIKDPNATRLREGDAVLACEPASTKATFCFFSNLGVAYTARVIDIPATTGYGEPIQKLFKLKDGEKIIAAYSMDPRVVGDIVSEDEDYSPEVHGIAATSDGYALRFSLAPFAEPSTRAGRKFARPKGAATVVNAFKCTGLETILAATMKCRAMVCSAEEVNYLSGPGRGVMLIKLGTGDHLLGFKCSSGERDLLRVVTNRGAEKTISTAKYHTVGRGGKGTEIQKNGTLARVLPEPVAPPVELTPTS